MSDLPLRAGWEGALAPAPHSLALCGDPGWGRKLHPYRNGARWAPGTGLPAGPGGLSPPGSGRLARTCTSGPGARSAPAPLGLPAHPGLMFPTQFSRAGGREWSVVSSQLLLGQHHGLHVGARELGPGRGSGGPLILSDALRPWAEYAGSPQRPSSPTFPGP